MEFVKSKKYKLFYGSCDINGEVKLNKLADIFSELADEQVDELIYDYPFLNNSDCRWILVRYNMQIKRMIRAEEVFKISTYQSYYSKYTCIRDYIVEDECGNEIMFAGCQWVMKNEHTGRICGVPKEFNNLTVDYNKEKRTELPKLDDFMHEEALILHTRYDDYDYNQHVNNAKYFSLIINEDLPFDQSKYNLLQVDINYKSGMLHGTSYKMSQIVKEENNCIILYQKIFDMDIAAIMRSCWELK